MYDTLVSSREEAISRAERHAPFLREAMIVRPDIVETFRRSGAETAAVEALQSGAETAGAELRRRRQALALAAALGDLSGELDLERVTRLLSDFADQSIERAVIVAMEELFPEEPPRGFSVIGGDRLSEPCNS